jgi:hypothetical protein
MRAALSVIVMLALIGLPFGSTGGRCAKMPCCAKSTSATLHAPTCCNAENCAASHPDQALSTMQRNNAVTLASVHTPAIVRVIADDACIAAPAIAFSPPTSFRLPLLI